MLCFEVTINGKKMCTAGIEDYGVITAIFSQVKTPPQANTEKIEDGRIDEPYFTVGGMVEDAQLEWLGGILEIGDEVTIRIIEANETDKPINQYREDPEELKKRKREFYEQCKLEFENE
jgi:hypothetical protein